MLYAHFAKSDLINRLINPVAPVIRYFITLNPVVEVGASAATKQKILIFFILS